MLAVYVKDGDLKRMRKAGLISLALAALLSATSASANVRYEASISDTQAKDWSTASSRISCVLSSNISGYGRADFTLLSGVKRRLSLEIFPSTQIISRSKMRIISAPPEWRPQGVENEIGEIDLYRGFRPFVGDSVSWSMLRELSNGQRILFPYLSEHPNFVESIVPVLSPMGFAKPYKEFIDCSAQLLPFGYTDVNLVALMFYETENRLTPSSQQRLDQQIEYCKIDTSVNKIIISSFGSGSEDNLDNIDLAKRRGDNIAKIFTDAGINKDIIEIRTYGDEQLATTGYTDSERRQSSKAIVELQRDQFKIDSRTEVEMPDVGVPEDWYSTEQE